MTAEHARAPRLPRRSPNAPPAPAHLSTASKRWWREIVRQYALEAHHLRLLEGAATAWDRAVQARELIATDGAVVLDRFGQAKPHPAAGIERDSLVAFARLCRELGFDAALPPPGVH